MRENKNKTMPFLHIILSINVFFFNRKFILMATLMGTNAVDVTRVHSSFYQNNLESNEYTRLTKNGLSFGWNLFPFLQFYGVHFITCF